MELERLVVDNNFEYVQIDTAPDPVPAPATGQIIWNSNIGSIQYRLADNTTDVDIGFEEIVRCYNAEANTLTKGEVVYIFGAQGDQVAIKRASNASDITSSKTLGMVASNIASAGTGYVISHGVITNIDTSAYTSGDILWLGNTAGTVTTTKPVAPNHGVFVGVVIKVNASAGQVYLKPQNGYELDEIHDVLLTTPASGDFLKYNGTVWINDPINLGTDTTGDYVASLVQGTGVTITNNSGEGSTPTIAIGQAVGTSNNVTFANITASQNLTVNGVITSDATAVLVNTNSATTVLSFPTATYRSGEILVQTTQGTKYSVSKIMVLHDGTTPYINEFGIIEIGSPRIPLSYSATISGGNVLLQATITDALSTNANIKYIENLIKV